MLTLSARHAPLTSPPWPEQGKWTHRDWLRLPEDGIKYEVIDGDLFLAHAPSIPHQEAAGNLFAALHDFVRKHRLGWVYPARTAVRVRGQKVPFQPDIFFIGNSRRKALREDCVDGTPDLMVEVLSPSNWTYDRNEKFQVYQAAGVPEYWIVDYRAKTVEVFLLQRGRYVLLNKYRAGESVHSRQLEGFAIRVSEIFAR